MHLAQIISHTHARSECHEPEEQQGAERQTSARKDSDDCRQASQGEDFATLATNYSEDNETALMVAIPASFRNRPSKKALIRSCAA